MRVDISARALYDTDAPDKRAVANHSSLTTAMQLHIDHAQVSVSAKGASILVLGGSLWVRSDALGPLKQSGSFDLVLDVSIRDVRAGDFRASAVRVERVVSATPVK